MKHERPSRDLPHARIRKEDGTSFPVGARRRSAAEYNARDVGSKAWNGIEASDRGPRRPAICMLFEDLAEQPSTGVFGMYPAALIPKVLPWLRCGRREVLHVCSGGLPPGEGIRVDIRPEARPDVVADGRKLPFADGSMAAVMLDPPYTEHYARELYGVEYPRPAHLLAEAARVVRPGGRIVFVHYLVANPPNGAHHVKTFGLSMGFGYPMRAVTVYGREQEGLGVPSPPDASRGGR